MGSSSKTPKEAENDLISVSKLKILDLISEGEITEFWPKNGLSGDNPLVSVYFDDVPVLESDGTPNINTSGAGFQFAYKLGASGEAALSNFTKVEALVPLPYSTRLFNPPQGKGDYRSVTVSFNTTSYPDANSVRVTLKVPALYQIDKDGNTNKYQLSYSIDISVNNGGFNTVLTNEIKGKCTSPYLKSHVITLPKPDSSGKYDWKLRVRRTSENIVNDSKTQNELYLEAVSILSSNDFSYPMSAMAGFVFGADQISSVPNRAYDVKGVRVSVPNGYSPTQFNPDNTINSPASYPTIWDGTWSTTKVWTNNPAWIYYDILTNKRYGLGNYFINDWIDKWTLYQIAQYCDELVDDGSGDTGGTYSGKEPRFTCNVCIQDKQDAFELITSLASVFRGISFWANGRIFAIQDRLKDPIFNYTNANIENGLFTYSDSARNTRSTVVNVKWNDPRNLFREKIETVEDQDGILQYGYIEKSLNAFACTSQGQAHRAGQWLLLTERMLTETVSFKVGLEGLVIRPGDIFNIYDNYRTNKKQGGRILSTNSSTAIVLDREVMIQSGVNYNLSVVIPQGNLEGTGDITGSNQIDLIRNSQIDTRSVLNSPGTTNEIILPSGFRTGLYNNITGSVWLLNGWNQNSGAFYETKTYKCINISESENYKFDIIGLQYDSGLYQLIETDFTIKSNPTNTGISIIVTPPTGINLYAVTGVSNGSAIFSILTTWDSITDQNFAYVKISGFYTGQEPKLLGTTNASQFNFYPDTLGDIGVSVGTVSIAGNESSFTSGSINIPFNVNPFGNAAQTSGIYISNGGSSTIITDSSSTISWGYTGDDPNVNFIQESYLNFFNTGFGVSGTGAQLVYKQLIPNAATSYDISVQTVQNFTGGAIRTFDLIVETVDSFDKHNSGAATRFTNSVPQPPTASGFWASERSITYNVLPSYQDKDLSGIAIWYNQNTGFTPTFNNTNFYSTTFGTTVPTVLNTGYVDIYFSLIDTLGSLECPIYGPISTQVQQNTLNGISAFGYPIISGNAIISGSGISVSQQDNIIIVAGTQGGTTLGGITGVGVSGNFTTGGINLLAEGSITLTQSGQNIIIGGGGGGGGTVITSTGDGIYLSLGNTGGQILSSGVFNAINWSSGIRSGILTFNQSSPSKIYIQTGCSGYYSISAYVNLNQNDLFDNYVWKKNGNNYLTNKSSNIVNTYLNDGDYLEFYINPIYSTSISGDINCDISNIKTITNKSNLPNSGNGYLHKDNNGNINWNSIFCKMIQVSGVPVLHGVEQKINFGKIETDTIGFLNNLYPSRISIPSGLNGNYIFTCTIEYSSNSDGYRQLYLVKNGSLVSGQFGYQTTNALNGAKTRISLTTAITLMENDFIEAVAYHNAGAGTTLTLETGYHTSFSCFKI